MMHTYRRVLLPLTGALLLGAFGCSGYDGDIEFSQGDKTSANSSGAGNPTATSGGTSGGQGGNGQGGSGQGGDGQGGSGDVPTEKFSFFVTSLKAMQEFSGNPNGFGGDLRFGETGPGSGLRGADKLCAAIADKSMPGAGKKQWRAFLSAVADENGNQVNAIDRIGEGPWYDRLGRLLAANKTDILNDRPVGADPAIKDDFPNEDGVPNHQPDPTQSKVDNHDFLTGTNDKGQLYSATSTCKDWTANLGDKVNEGKPRVGHSWPRYGGPGPGGDINMVNWMSSLIESGCAPGVNLLEEGGPKPDSNTVGSGGGYGGIYCFALTP
jgi:hypothetical protein